MNEPKTLKAALVVIADLQRQLAEAQDKLTKRNSTATEAPSFATSLHDSRPFMPASAGGVAQPWESLWRECQAALHGGRAPRISGLPNKSCPAGHKDPAFPYSIRERAAMEKVRESLPVIMGDLREKCLAAFAEAGETPEATSAALPAYVPKSTW